VLAQIDDFIFDINDTSFDNFKRTISYRFNTNQRLGNFDSWQSSGKHEETIEIKGKLIVQSQSQFRQFEIMAQAKLPRTLAFTDGTCKTVIILGLELDRSGFLKDGAFLKQAFKIDIAVVGDGFSFNV
jgi:phage protein U